MSNVEAYSIKAKSLLDDEQLMSRLLSQAKPSHSAIGRAADVTLSFMTLPRTKKAKANYSERSSFGNNNNNNINNNSDNAYIVKPVVTGINKQAKKIELHQERARQHAWACADAQESLQIAELGTLLPSFTSAAATSVSNNNSNNNNNSNLTCNNIYNISRSSNSSNNNAQVNKLHNANYSTLIALCPTSANVNSIEDKDELISSFRAYRVDALRAEREKLLRASAAPHPDWLHSMDPLANELDVRNLVDLATLPISAAYNVADNNTTINTTTSIPTTKSDNNNDSNNNTCLSEEESIMLDGREKVLLRNSDNLNNNNNNNSNNNNNNDNNNNNSKNNIGTTKENDDINVKVMEQEHDKRVHGTYSFLCQGREELERAQNGFANSKAKERCCFYYPRYTIVQPRIVGGYVAPPSSTSHLHQYTKNNNNSSSQNNGSQPNHNTTDIGYHSRNAMTVENVQALQSQHGEITYNINNNNNNNNDQSRSHGHSYSPGSQNDHDNASIHPSSANESNSRQETHPSHLLRTPTEIHAENEPSNLVNIQDTYHTSKPGENVKGSSMFISATPRDTYNTNYKDANIDVIYWPYPDIRSSTHRTREPVRFSNSVHTRRREPPISGVPAAVYDVTQDIGSHLHCTVPMQTMTTRDSHWYGKNNRNTNHNTNNNDKNSVANRYGALGNETQMSCDELNRALAMTRPNVKAATLPPRLSKTSHKEEEEYQERQYKWSKKKQKYVDDNKIGVSVEANLNFPPSTIGTLESMQHAPSFEHMRSHDTSLNTCKSSHKKHNKLGKKNVEENEDNHEKGNTQNRVYHDARRNIIEKKVYSTIIHPNAPGHASLQNAGGAGLHTEIGNIPNLKWVKPTVERTTAFGAGSTRPSHLLPLHDLSYDTVKSYSVIDPHVKGDPMIGTHLTREQRAQVHASKHCAPDVQYNLPTSIYSSAAASSSSALLPSTSSASPSTAFSVILDKPKLIPAFDKQITKETQFCGHRIPSERWERSNPKAPGPGSYNISYNQVEKVL